MIRRDHRSLLVAASAASLVLTAAALATGAESKLESKADEIKSPPGLVEIEGGRIPVGADEDFLIELIKEHEDLRNALVAELGGKSMRLDDFFLMPTEVTNEQFAAFLRATGAEFRPPNAWLDQTAMIAARDKYLAAENEKKQELLAQGERYTVQPFDDEGWFDRNWQSLEWSVPKGQETLPVTFVNHGDARDYAEWAGLRLMTEFEFQAAARGTREQQWPWGDEWDPSKNACLTNNDSRIQPVGSSGWATEAGVHDLIGNVWEWTDSPYAPYDDYDPVEIAFGSSKTEKTLCAADFNADERVSMGGSVDYDLLTNRVTTRKGTPRFFRNEKLGFRCAATGIHGQDLMRGVGRTARGYVRPKTPIDPERAVALHRWTASSGSAEIDGYAVIEDYQYVGIAPVEELDGRNMSALGIESLKQGPIDLGLLTTSVPLVEPPLAPGTYKLSWRDKGPDRRDDEEQDGDDEEAEEVAYPYNINEVNLLITDEEGTVVAIFDGSDADVVKEDRDAPNGKLQLIPYVPPKSEKRAAEETPLDSIDVTLDVPSSSNGRVARFVFGLRLAAGTIDESWIGVGK